MHDKLIRYINNPYYSIANFDLALWYEEQGYVSPACGLYLRCIQFTEDKYLIYECLLRMYFCFLSAGSRDYTCEHLLKSAINILPQLPHAYFLLCQMYEKKQNWMDMYFFSSSALDVCNFDNKIAFRTTIDPPAKYTLVFQKALSSWWYGKADESRVLFQQLMIHYGDDLDMHYYSLVENNISKIGTGKLSQSTIPYKYDRYYDLKFKFNGLESIDHNFSQVLQDIFVLTVLDGKKNGCYLEIGSSHPLHNNNTFLLEKLGWSGLGIEKDQKLVEEYISCRKNPILCCDATILNYNRIISSYFNTSIIDYLQLDIEPCKNTFEALLSIPFNKYSFRIITYEHDYYIDMTRSYRQKSRNYLTSLGYELLFNDISTDHNSTFEDWWVKPDLIDKNILNQLRSIKLDTKINPISQLMFN